MRSYVVPGFLIMSLSSAAALVACGSSGDDAPTGPDGATPPTGTTDGAAPVNDDDGGDRTDDAGADAGGDAGAETCPVGALCDGTYNYAFITSTEQNLTDIGGVAGADALCNVRAAAAGLPGTYVAWLSSSTSAAKTRLGAASGWIRTDRRPFAASADDLYASKIRYPLQLDEFGALTAESSGISTATSNDGTAALKNCEDWVKSGSDDGVLGGYPRFGSNRWTVGRLSGCNLPTHVYCFGKDHAAPLPSSAVTGRLAFITSAPFDVTSGLAGADAQCQADANAAKLSGTYKALLATKAASAISRFSTAGATWVRRDGVALWASAADALSNAPLIAPLLQKADGEVAPSFYLWTGAGALNVVGTDTCDDWSTNSAAKKGGYGSGEGAGDWFRSSFTCDKGPNFGAGAVCFQE